MSFVVKDPKSGLYLAGRDLHLEEDLQKARVFQRQADAKNSLKRKYQRAIPGEIVEVRLYEVPDDMILDALERHG
jgi:hypothetical protein